MPKTAQKGLIITISTLIAVQPVLAFTGTSGSYTDYGTSTSSTNNSHGGISIYSSNYKGVPGSSSNGNINTSGGIGLSSSGNTSSGINYTSNVNTSSGVGYTNGQQVINTSTGVNINSPDYKGVPGATQTGGNVGYSNGNPVVNTSTGVNINSPDYKGTPGNRIESQCGGNYYPLDIDGHWAEIYIRRLYDLCITVGYTDGTFRPDTNVTRAELTKMAIYSNGIQPDPGCYNLSCGTPFNDLIEWQGQWIRPAWLKGIVQGYGRNTFAPNKSITRAEAVKVILATYGYKAISTSKSFFKDVHGWSTGWIELAHQIGIVQGIGNGNFDPDRPVTRAEAAKIIAKMKEYAATHNMHR